MTEETMFGEGMDPEDMEETETETFEAEIKVPKSKRGDKDLSDAPIENAADIPLFADADKRGLKTVTYLKLIKLDTPGNGYKGHIPLNSTLETIGQLHGDGIYNIQACNHKHQVIREIENVRIALGDSVKKESTNIVQGGRSNGVDAKDHHINKLVNELSASRKRDIDLADKSIQQIQEQGKSFVSLVQTTTESAAQRDREHMRGVNEGQQQFFAGMLQQTNQMFQQMMALMMTSHSHTLQVIQASNERDREQNNPLAMVQVLMQGLKMGREMDSDDTPDWLKATGLAKDALGSLATLATAAISKPKQLPVVANPAPTQQEKPKKKNKRVLSDDELLEVVRLKRALNAKGMDLKSMAAQARVYYEKSDSSEDSSDLEDDNEETEAAKDNLEREGDNDSNSAEG